MLLFWLTHCLLRTQGGSGITETPLRGSLVSMAAFYGACESIKFLLSGAARRCLSDFAASASSAFVGDAPKALLKLGLGRGVSAAVNTAASVFFAAGPLPKGGLSSLHFAVNGDSFNALDCLASVMPDFVSVLNTDAPGAAALLFTAVDNKNLDLVERLVRLGADLALVNSFGRNIVQQAASNLSAEELQRLLAVIPADARAGLVVAVSKDGHTALMVAASRGDESVVRALLANGARVEARRDFDGCNVAHLLVAHNKPTILKEVLAADPASVRRGVVSLASTENNAGLTLVDITVNSMLQLVSAPAGGVSVGVKRVKARRAVSSRAAGRPDDDEPTEEPDAPACFVAARSSADGRRRQLVTFDDVQKSVSRDLKKVVCRKPCGYA
jgi:ankyrin repeat protein